MITIVDYGMGNLGSIQNMLGRIGIPCLIAGDPETIARAEKLILPGVGAFDQAMNNIRAAGLEAVLRNKAIVEHTPAGHLLGHADPDGQKRRRSRQRAWADQR
jgi:glutamine amidotransferase